ncbi:hypothetical protein COO60DRAFT_615568 [Scenedesmus sp. NREL 46B-D3]|nr:hypothetical protein COO60DRAFT_615568 [Scenedesmus sp. NREL 46B-D3]
MWCYTALFAVSTVYGLCLPLLLGSKHLAHLLALWLWCYCLEHVQEVCVTLSCVLLDGLKAAVGHLITIRTCLSCIVRGWCLIVSAVAGPRSALLPDCCCGIASLRKVMILLKGGAQQEDIRRIGACLLHGRVVWEPSMDVVLAG